MSKAMQTPREKAVELIASMNLLIEGRHGMFTLPISEQMAEEILDQVEQQQSGKRVLGRVASGADGAKANDPARRSEAFF